MDLVSSDHTHYYVSVETKRQLVQQPSQYRISQAANHAMPVVPHILLSSRCLVRCFCTPINYRQVLLIRSGLQDFDEHNRVTD